MKASQLMIAITLALAPAALATTHQPSSPNAGSWTQAEVKKVDRDARKITLKHEEIANLQMPPMTMVFAVKDQAVLDKVKAGDAVRFTAEKIGGTFTVTGIEPAAK